MYVFRSFISLDVFGRAALFSLAAVSIHRYRYIIRCVSVYISIRIYIYIYIYIYRAPASA